MDPATVLGVTSAIITFIEFSAELIGGACEVYKSLDGYTDENVHINDIVDDLCRASDRLTTPLSTDVGNLSANEDALIQLAAKCRDKCAKLQATMTKLRPKSSSTWSSFRSAWMSRRRKSDIACIYSELSDYRSAITMRVAQMQYETLSQLMTNLKIRADTDSAITKRIKEQLFFKSLYSREDGIKTPATDTFEWIRDVKESQLKNSDVPRSFVDMQVTARERFRSQYHAWLGPSTTSSPSSSILHISGKAGCGKSTLMRHLLKSSFTTDRLQAWAGSKKLICVSFYFWMASNDRLQTSVDGLYRTILFKTLEECPQLAVYLFPDQWKSIQTSLQRDQPRDGQRDEQNHASSLDATLFRSEAIAEAMRRLTASDASLDVPYALAIFVDGLDEHQETEVGWGRGTNYGPGHTALMKKIVQWGQAGHVKICTTARPYTEFIEVLERFSLPILHLHTTTVCDIYQSSKQMFEESDDFGNFKSSEYLELCSEITTRSSGVFVWAILTTRVMIESLSLGDSRKTQQKKLAAIPSELNDLYSLLLSQISTEDRPRSNDILSLVLNRPELDDGTFHLPLYWISWLDDATDRGFPVASAVQTYTKDEIKRRCNVSRRLLSRLTRGIVEAVYIEEAETNVRDTILQVAFFHRTAFDYVKRRNDQKNQEPASWDFDADDVYGRLCVADFVSTRQFARLNITHAVERILDARHKNRAHSLEHLSEVISVVIKDHWHKSDDCECGSIELEVGSGQYEQNPSLSPKISVSPLAFILILISAEDLANKPWHDIGAEPNNHAKKVWESLSQMEQFFFVVCLLNDQHFVLDDIDVILDILAKDDFRDYIHVCNTDSNNLPCPPWMAILARYLHLMESKHEMPVLLQYLVPGDAWPCATITLHDEKQTVVYLKDIKEMEEREVSRLLRPARDSLSVDYGEYHSSWNFSFHIDCFPEDG